ncbi:GDSL-type esterase/lipase family protein [Actinoplanes sp. NPDC051494]|uniref:GDSL-type esterase/lipase family protein n=1 Tax=Actinoplanes sp. NPDC051494 TaxID=3363907 RepID=UPI0037932FC9
MRRRSVLGLAGAAVPATLLTDPAAAGAGPPGRRARRVRWVHSWVAMPQLTEPGNLPPAPFTGPGSLLAGTTLRQTVHLTLGGGQVRVRFSNAFGTTDLPITAAAVAEPAGGRAGSPAIEAGTSRDLTFSGRPSAVVPPGAQVVSDPVPLPVRPGTELTITAYLATGQAGSALTSHPGSRTTSHLILGDHHTAPDLPGATPVDHWYLISGVEVAPAHIARALVIVGDSLTDGRGSTTNGNDRWPDQLAARLRARPRTAGVAVLNQAAGGNRLLNDGLGPSVLARLDRDVLTIGSARWLLLFEGVNDIGTTAATEEAQQRVVADVLSAYIQIGLRVQALDLEFQVATLTPFGGHEGYDDPGGLRARSRQAVNAWIRSSDLVDTVVDFDAAVRDPAVPTRLAAAYDVGDHLHLNPTGYAALAAAYSLG